MPRTPKKPIEQVVGEVGRYPIDAFAFVQECIGIASERVHGPMGPAETAIAQWMTQHDIDIEKLKHLEAQQRLPAKVAQALAKVGGAEQMNRHVTGQQLCWAIRDVALQRWGLMARSVLARWNVKATDDIGAIIFALVDSDWLQKQPTDTHDDFKNVFSFREALDSGYHISEEP